MSLPTGRETVDRDRRQEAAWRNFDRMHQQKDRLGPPTDEEVRKAAEAPKEAAPDR